MQIKNGCLAGLLRAQRKQSENWGLGDRLRDVLLAGEREGLLPPHLQVMAAGSAAAESLALGQGSLFLQEQQRILREVGAGLQVGTRSPR